MNELLHTAMYDESKRLTVASRSPINVFVNGASAPRFVSDETGDYWPYRWVSEKDVAHNTKTVKRLTDRCETLCVAQEYPVEQMPTDVLELARKTDSDRVIPRTLFTGTYALDELITLYDSYDARSQPKLIIPISYPFAETFEVVTRVLSRTRPTVPDICLTGSYDPTDSETLNDIRRINEKTPAKTHIHLLNVAPSVQLVRVIRDYPHLFSSVLLDSPEKQTDSQNVSQSAKRDLGASVSHGVKQGAVFSLLCSKYVSSSEVSSLSPQSVIPLKEKMHV